MGRRKVSSSQTRIEGPFKADLPECQGMGIVLKSCCVRAVDVKTLTIRLLLEKVTNVDAPEISPGPMNSISTSIVIIPGVVALLLCLLFTYLYQQSQQAYFRAWQIAWACYSIHYALDAVRYYRPPALAAFFFSSLFSVAMAMSIFVSTRLTRDRFPLSLVRRGARL